MDFSLEAKGFNGLLFFVAQFFDIRVFFLCDSFPQRQFFGGGVSL